MKERILVLIAEGSFSSSLAFLIVAILFGLFSISIPEDLTFAKYSVLGRGWAKLRS